MKSKAVFNFTCLLLLACSINSCKSWFNNSDDNITDPKTLMEKYLTTKKWQDRLLYILDSSAVKPVMEEYYKNVEFIKLPKISDINQIKIIDSSITEDSVMLISITFIDKEVSGDGIKSAPVFYYVKNTKNGLKVDWLGSIGYNPIKLNVYKATKPKDAVIFRLACKLSDYYNYGYREKENEYYSILCTSMYNNDHEEDASLTGYILKKSDDGIKLFEILKDGNFHYVTIALKYDYKSEGSSAIVAIKKFINAGWHYNSSAGAVDSEVLLDYLVNPDNADFNVYKQFPYNPESEFQKKIMTYFEQGTFIIEREDFFKGKMMGRAKEYCILTDESLEINRRIVSDIFGNSDQTMHKMLIKLPTKNENSSWEYKETDSTVYSCSSEFTELDYKGINTKAIKVTENMSYSNITLTTYRYYLKGVGFYKECQKDSKGEILTTLILE